MRDERPLSYSGRILTAANGNVRRGIWRKTGLIKFGSIGGAPQLSANDMVMVDDLADDALPSTTDERTQVTPSVKWAQLGEATMETLLMGLLRDMDTDGKKYAIVIADLSVNVGCALRAFVNMYPSLQIPIFFFGMADDTKQLEFVKDVAVDKIAGNFRRKRFLK